MGKAARSKSARVTLGQVAHLAGVSTTAVSVILSGRPSGLKQFHPDTIDRVRRSADKLGYRANLFASSIATRDSTFFALVIEDLAETKLDQWHLWAFEGELLSGIISSAAAAGLYPVIATDSSSHENSSTKPIEDLIAGGVMGTIVRTPNAELEKHLRFRIKQGHPVIVVFPSRSSRWKSNVIDLDNHRVGEKAAELLHERGCRRCAIAHYKKRSEPHRHRCEGFESTCERLGMAFERIVLPLEIDDVGIGEWVERRLKRMNVEGFFGIDSIASIGMVMGCLRADIRLGDRAFLVGCDTSLWQSSMLPRITSIDLSWKEVGILATERLTVLAAHREAEFESILLPPAIKYAETCPGPCQTQGEDDEATAPKT